MKQLTLRVDERLADQLKGVAAREGKSVNAYAAWVLAAAVDPDLAEDETARLRQRLARAGLLSEGGGRVRRPPDEEVARARAEAGEGPTLVSDLVSEGRG